MSNAAGSLDSRLATVRHLDVHYPAPQFETLAQWKARAKELRTHVLACAGLLPLPERTPLNPQVLGRIEGDDYVIEMVTLQTLPGFTLCGNLFLPKGKRGPFPAIANPHGHWANGRLAHEELGSIPARCITQARMGCVAFSYDMVGYNDTNQVPHTYGGDREALWGISLGGLQLWNSIRVLDYLESLPDVDPNRLGVTGESGGGTQTFMVSAVDDRVKVAAPVNMISLQMQGGCLCENMPNMRVECTNVEIGALMAPRPLLMVAATGDWTKNTLEEEFPAIRSVYRLYGAEERVHAVRFDAPHNYNLQSREAVYAWMNRWLLGKDEPVKEGPIALEDTRTLLVFPTGQRPPETLDAEALTQSLVARSEAQLTALWPRDEAGLTRFRETYAPLLRHSVGVEAPRTEQVTATPAVEAPAPPDTRATRLALGRAGKGDRVPALLLSREGKRAGAGTLVVHPEGIAGLYDGATGKPAPIVDALLRQGRTVLLVDTFLTGSSQAPPERAEEIGKRKFFATYNRTDVDNRVQDILTALAYLRGRPEVSRTRLVAEGAAGLWGLLAAALDARLDAAALDLAGFDLSDERFLSDLYVPGLRRAGDLRAAAALCAPRRLFLHNAAGSFPTEQVATVFQAAGEPERLRVSRGPANAEDVVAWLSMGQ